MKNKNSIYSIQYFMNIENDGKELTINNILIEYK